MGYAIPISQAKEILDRLTPHRTEREVEEARRGYLGIQGTSVDAQSAVMFGMPEGVFVYKILEGGAAYGSGLKEKDIITKVDGQTVRTMEELQALLTYYEQGEEIELTVQTQERALSGAHGESHPWEYAGERRVAARRKDLTG